MGETRVIKRYANRKLYDTVRSRYVTLDQISEMIRAGEDVKIVDNNSKEDLTSVTLAQIIFEEEKKQKSFLPLHAMRNIIQSGGERLEELVTQAQKRVADVFRKPPTDPSASSVPADPTGEADEAGKGEETESSAAGRAMRELRELLEASQRTIEEWQRRWDERVRHVVEGISPFAGINKEVASLSARLIEVEQRLAGLLQERTDDDVTPAEPADEQPPAEITPLKPSGTDG